MKDINLIRKIAWSFHQTTGLDVDDLFQEAALAYCEAQRTCDETRGKPSVYVWKHMERKLIDYLKRERKYNQHTTLDVPVIQKLKTVNSNPILNALDTTTKQAAEILLLTPHRFLTGKRQKRDKEIQKALTEQGWDRRKIMECLHFLRMNYT